MYDKAGCQTNMQRATGLVYVNVPFVNKALTGLAFGFVLN